ncbi:MAG: hypothetical protein DMF44_06535 [Verrucomicrobia bacterium]|nr:MAG: hypothetical protein DMF44_06535 [Verrucomicrobiota bacterium]
MATIQSPFEGSEGMQIYQADTGLKKAFGVGAALIAVASLVAVSCLGRNGNTSFSVSSPNTNCKAPPYMRIGCRTQHMNTFSQSSLARLSGSKNTLAEHCTTGQYRADLA